MRFNPHLNSLRGSRKRGAAKLYDVLLRGERWVVKKRRSYAFSHRGAHFCLRRGWGKRGDFTWLPTVKHQRRAAKTTNSNCCDRAVAQVKQHPNNPGERTVLKKLLSTEQISKKGIKLILKTIGNRKGDCA